MRRTANGHPVTDLATIPRNGHKPIPASKKRDTHSTDTPREVLEVARIRSTNVFRIEEHYLFRAAKSKTAEYIDRPMDNPLRIQRDSRDTELSSVREPSSKGPRDKYAVRKQAIEKFHPKADKHMQEAVHIQPSGRCELQFRGK